MDKSKSIITAGIDAGSESTKVVVLRDANSFQWTVANNGIESTERLALNELTDVSRKASVKLNDISKIAVTGVNREFVTFAHQGIPEFICLAKGINIYFTSVKTILDIGAQKSLAIKCDTGKAKKWVTSGRCATGTITYLQIMANTLKVDIDKLDELYFKSKLNLDIQSSCAVFAESEIISLVHGNTHREDIVRAVFRGLADKLYSQLLELGLENDLAVVGGIAR
ncbi:MAG: hypothetical protein JW967_04900, partial [Dehalococcoidales bacterium]|nr:hypothetical protein [Dehalococcoidales bacterium]